MARIAKGWSRLWRPALVTAACLLALAGAGAWKVQRDIDRLAPLPQVADLPLSVVVLDRNDQLLRAFTSKDEKWRLPVELADVDPLYVEMLLAFEDKRFFDHGGVDVRAFLRSLVQSLHHGRVVSGGSTLTMQVARLLHERPTKSVRRKYEQILTAFKLERTFKKRDILRFYLLRAPFGGNVEGIRAASLTWFGKEPGRLTAAEAALLVALPQSPEARRPDRFGDNARKARNRVLARAAAAGVISKGEAQSAAAEPVRTRRYDMPLLAAHESRHVRNTFPARTHHRLTLDKALQATLEAQARRRANALPSPVSLAIIVADHSSGDILARLGSPDLLDETRLGHVDMTRAIRSPGSTLKPFIYGLAFEEGIGVPESLIADKPTNIGGYQPTNFDRAYQGTVTLREALQLSLNTPAVQLLESVGPARLMARLKRGGTRPVLEKGRSFGLAISLGGLGLTLKDLAQAYGALASGGAPVRLKTCRANCPEDVWTAGTLHMLSPKSAGMVTDILKGMPQARGAETQQIAYKTGTSYGYRDAWAVGFDGRHVVAVWVGRMDGSPVPGQTGQKNAVPLLFEVFQKLGPNRVPLPNTTSDLPTAWQSSVPPSLKFARTSSHRFASDSVEALSIAYPPNGAELDLGLTSTERGWHSAQPLVVKFKGGVAPYAILVNGRPHQTDYGQYQLVLQPEAPGFTNVTVMDAKGESAAVSIKMR
ncbi:penicillin-binding protein 1C [Roseibium sp. HPY-6]|uniref:penicillin-binding protein 1C n=1 Tax=Roseibium sp. HPY-6 TaxID=3229852 RepID=UPI00338FABC0